ncbi:hypothetical protein PJ985_20800 [Streptomyces sp. ACA25]|uniref:hypothetical protein n=1 Tax=Streptomyces sp. ACA25 TaxID=3022596 RepID=UPI002307912F|nr:hypothetical protein [Streptomyces sp. ACA25]MDB1090002.1 hypothetical protein [Streptomyces sp. ACA25]
MRHLLRTALLIPAIGACTTVSPPTEEPAGGQSALQGRLPATVEATAPADSPLPPEPDEDVTPASPRSDSVPGSSPHPRPPQPSTAPRQNTGTVTGSQPDGWPSPTAGHRARPSIPPLPTAVRGETEPPFGLPAVGPVAEELCDSGRENRIAEQHLREMCKEVLPRGR